MKLIKQPNNWSCFACVMAMATETTLDDVIEFCGHDGSEFWEKSIHPEKRRGFFLQEMSAYANSRRYQLGGFVSFRDKPIRLYNYDKIAVDYPISKCAVLSVANKQLKGCLHVVYWDGEQVYDPSEPKPVSLRNYKIAEYWPIAKIE